MSTETSAKVMAMMSTPRIASRMPNAFSACVTACSSPSMTMRMTIMKHVMYRSHSE